MFKRLLLAASLLLAATAAQAQSTCPSIITNAILTAAQWNSCFSSKQDALGFTPVNKAGDSMSGALTLPAPGTVGSINLTPGTAPSAPVNGDLWTTASGLFARINGVTVGPFAGGATVNSVFGRTGVVTATSGDYTVAQVTGAAPLASPTFTGVPAAPTAAGGTNTTQIATTAFVQAAVAGGGAVTSVFGRNGVVTAASGDYSVAQVTGAAPTLSPTFTGTPTAPTATAGTNTTQLATTAFVGTAVTNGTASLAPLASPTFTGTPAAPTAAPGTNTTQVATTAFVQAAASGFVPVPSSSALPVGTVAFMFKSLGTAVNDGNTDSGSNLSAAIFNGTAVTSSGSTQSGTWKNISGATISTGYAGLFVRIS